MTYFNLIICKKTPLELYIFVFKGTYKEYKTKINNNYVL